MMNGDCNFSEGWPLSRLMKTVWIRERIRQLLSKVIRITVVKLFLWIYNKGVLYLQVSGIWIRPIIDWTLFPPSTQVYFPVTSHYHLLNKWGERPDDRWETREKTQIHPSLYFTFCFHRPSSFEEGHTRRVDVPQWLPKSYISPECRCPFPFSSLFSLDLSPMFSFHDRPLEGGSTESFIPVILHYRPPGYPSEVSSLQWV